MEKMTFRRFDAAEYLETEEDIAGFLDDSAESGDAAVMLNALAIVARARNMTTLAESVGMSRSGLYKALSNAGNPSFDLVDKIARSMGYRVSIVKIAVPTPNGTAKKVVKKSTAKDATRPARGRKRAEVRAE